ncbi:hypothetical protein MPSEU_001003300 [Mayamaea pseudoterrestris]|nr:hypothetical protein MPSEU_001003300 [Mayamaea pseudoterrestris]
MASVGVQRRSMQMVPRLGSEADMTKEAVEQIRARVAYQKSLLAAKGHSIDEEVKEMWRWVNITFMVGIPIVVASAVYSFFFDVHPHRFDGELPEYMHVRNKEFPWECSDCDIFDGACWKKCRAEKQK